MVNNPGWSLQDKEPQVNKRTQKKRPVVSPKSSGRKKTRRKGGMEGFKKKLNLLIIWSLVVVNSVLIFSLITKILNMPSMQAAMSPDPDSVPADPLTVTVLNGCGVQGLASRFRDVLVENRYDVRTVGNADDTYNQTVLIDGQKRSETEVEELRNLLGLDKDQVIPLKSSNYTTDVQLILGQDYSSLKIYKSIR